MAVEAKQEEDIKEDHQPEGHEDMTPPRNSK